MAREQLSIAEPVFFTPPRAGEQRQPSNGIARMVVDARILKKPTWNLCGIHVAPCG